MIFCALAALSARYALADPSTLPVYQVSSSGASASQAGSMASALNIPTTMLAQSNGRVSFVDPANFLWLPLTEVTDAAARSNALARTVNKYPPIPLGVQSLDLNALSNLTVLDEASALSAVTNAMNGAGLGPQFGTPLVSHATLSLSYSNAAGTLVTNSQSLDTKVTYNFVESGGYPMFGPGAQVQAEFRPGSGQQCARLLYATRQLATGPSVTLFGATEASNRVASGSYSGLNAQVTAQLVYFCPSLSLPSVAKIIPHYLCGGTGTGTNPSTGTTFTFSLMQTLIPATDDPGYVPAPILTVSAPGGTQVVASVAVTGGQPPYTYKWHGSSPAVSGNSGPNVTYTPLMPVAPGLRMDKSGANVTISWLDPSDNLALESAPASFPPAWAPDIHSLVTTSNGLKAIIVDLNTAGASRLFRVHWQSGAPRAERVHVTVTDANGVSVQASRTVMAEAAPWLWPGPAPSPSWGTESPYYLFNDAPDIDTDSWLAVMRGHPSAGTENFFWADQQSFDLDFIRTDVDQGSGWADTRGVNTADIVMYVGHGSPDSFEFTTIKTGSLEDNDRRLPHSWGHDQLEWLGLDACNVMQQPDQQHQGFAPCEKRWGPAFDGLHAMLGFTTPSFMDTSFPGDFAERLLGVGSMPLAPMSVVKAWFLAAKESGVWSKFDGYQSTGTPAAMGPLMKASVPDGHGGQVLVYLTDSNDFYWGNGPVGPAIPADQISGFWYLSN